MSRYTLRNMEDGYVITSSDKTYEIMQSINKFFKKRRSSKAPLMVTDTERPEQIFTWMEFLKERVDEFNKHANRTQKSHETRSRDVLSGWESSADSDYVNADSDGA